MITIELAEYEALKNTEKRFKKLRVADYHEGLKILLTVFTTTHFTNLRDIMMTVGNELKKKGLIIWYQNDMGQGTIDMDIIREK